MSFEAVNWVTQEQADRIRRHMKARDDAVEVCRRLVRNKVHIVMSPRLRPIIQKAERIVQNMDM